MIFNFIFILSINYLSFDKNGKHTFSFKGKGEEIYLKRGKYEIDVYGAQGGRGYADGILGGDGGPGAQVHGEFYITSNESIKYYIFVGEQGARNSRDLGSKEGPNRGGFNGGGAGGADIKWSDTEGLPNDASGGGGGATDIRTSYSDTKTRLIVAGGGSGGAYFCNGSPGGALCGMTSAGHCNKYECSKDTNTDYSDETGKKCEYPNGQGGSGVNHGTTPPSGGGGGYCGGKESKTENFVSPPISDSGSSYAKECKNGYDKELCFYNVKMYSGKRKGDGSLTITRIWECKDENCLYCKNAANQCETCKQGYSRYNGKCVASCPDSFFSNGIDCVKCSQECKTCQNTKNECTSCFNSYYLYNNSCHSNCSWINNVMINSFFGKDSVENKCQNCIDENCINCNENYKICSSCAPLYYLNETTKKCIHIPTNQFSESTQFSESIQFSESTQFSESIQFSKTEQFSESEQFSETRRFSKSNEFSESKQFSESIQFTKTKQFSGSEQFSESIQFSKTEQFSESEQFSKTKSFSESKYFSESEQFSESKRFSESEQFSETRRFSKSNKFSESKQFSESIQFTKTKQFSGSEQFSESKQFSRTERFSGTKQFSNTEHFSETNKFSNTEHFTKTTQFSETKPFTETEQFSETEFFSKTKYFSITQIFTDSNQFSNSQIFSQSNFFTTPYKRRTTTTISILLSNILLRSVSFSISHYYSYVFSMINVNGQISFIPEESFILGYFPYIIYFYSITNIPTLIIIELPYRRRLSKEMLIGICCGCSSIFFFTIGLIIMIYKKLKKKETSDDGDLFSEEEENNQFINKGIEYQDKNIISPKTESDLDLDFWL